MEPRGLFQYLDIQSCWPTAEADLERYATHVTLRGWEGMTQTPGGPDMLTRMVTLQDPHALCRALTKCPHAVLQMCVLTLAPFQECTDTQLRDLHLVNPSKTFECPQRPLLIEAFVDALLLYEKELREGTWGALESFLREGEAAAEAIELMTIAYRGAYKMLTSKPITRKRAASLVADLKKIAAVMNVDVYKAYVKLTKIDECNRLVTRMLQAFDHYGPPPEQPRYSPAAQRYSIALILQLLGIEAGTPEQIAARLKKRRDRAKKSARF
jgi:hypothetical protein